MTAAVRSAGSARTWVVATVSGEAVTGYLPAWAEEDPSRSGVRPDRLHIALADIFHQAEVGGLVLPVVHGPGPAVEAGVLVVTVGCKPFGEDDEPRIPVVNVQVVDDFWLRDLDPDAVAGLGVRLQGLGRHLVGTVAPGLAAARADWARHSRSVAALPEEPGPLG